MKKNLLIVLALVMLVAVYGHCSSTVSILDGYMWRELMELLWPWAW